MEFLKLTLYKIQYLLLKLTFQKAHRMTHGAEEHDGCDTADLTDTLLLPWSLPNTSAGSQEHKNFKANGRNK